MVLDRSSGQTLVEAMVALGIITAGLLALFALIASSISAQRIVADRITATYLAAEGIEIVKNFIDTNALRAAFGCSWNNGAGCIELQEGAYEVDYASDSLFPDQNRFLARDTSTGLYGYSFAGAAEATPFVRRVTLVFSPDGDEMRVNSFVYWKSRGGEYNINVEDHFYNYR